jgi:hypothetical protein
MERTIDPESVIPVYIGVGSIMDPHHELRRQERRTCDESVGVQWRDPRGEEKFVSARALDICESGLRLQMPEALARQTYVSLRATRLGLMGNACVRHCTRTKGAKYAIGVEFTAGLHWTPKA